MFYKSFKITHSNGSRYIRGNNNSNEISKLRRTLTFRRSTLWFWSKSRTIFNKMPMSMTIYTFNNGTIKKIMTSLATILTKFWFWFLVVLLELYSCKSSVNLWGTIKTKMHLFKNDLLNNRVYNKKRMVM